MAGPSGSYGNYQADWGSANSIVQLIHYEQRMIETLFIKAEIDPKLLASILSGVRSFYANYRPFIGKTGKDEWTGRIKGLTARIRKQKIRMDTIIEQEGTMNQNTTRLCLNDDYFTLLDELRDAYDEVIQMRQKVGGGLPSKKLKQDSKGLNIERGNALLE